MLSVKCASQFVGTLVTIWSIQSTFSGGKNVEKRNKFYRRTCVPIFASVCHSRAWSIDPAGCVWRSWFADCWKIRKCLEYFRSRNRKFLYADGYFYHYKSCNGLHRNNRASHRRTKTKRSRKCGRNYDHSFSDHCCHHDICTGICRRRNCASFTGTGWILWQNNSLYQNLFCRYRYYHCIQCNQRGAARCGKCKPSTSVRRNCLRHKYSGRFASGWSISHGCCGCRHCHCICTVCLCRLFCRCIKKAGYAYRIFQRTMSDL